MRKEVNKKIDNQKNKKLEKEANNIRKRVVDMVYTAKSGHIGGSLSSAEIASTLFFHTMNYKEYLKDLSSHKRDKFILSKGHASPLIYAILIELGLVDEKEQHLFRNIEGILQGHPDKLSTLGVDYSAGSLGQGLSFATGIGIAYKYEESKGNECGDIYVLIGDGEMQEGQIWEALMAISNFELDNIIIILDKNNIQLDGKTEDIMNIDPIEDKLKAFGYETYNIDGHDIEKLASTFHKIKEDREKLREKKKNSKIKENNIKLKPSFVIANTIKGKGVSFMEDNIKWHGYAPNEEEYNKAMDELKNKK